MKKAVLLAFVLVFLSTAVIVGFIRPVDAQGAIYIRADGSIDPPTANIMTVDQVTYTFTSSIHANVGVNGSAIVVERDNIVVDGGGYTLQGSGSGIGINMTWRNNVILKNVEITNFTEGIRLSGSNSNILIGNNASNNLAGIYLRFGSSNNTLAGNNALNNQYGIYLWSSSDNNLLAGNTASNNNETGISIHSSSNNVLAGNTVSDNNVTGIFLLDSSNNTLSGNTALNNYNGIYLSGSKNNTLLHNNFINNINQVSNAYSINIWDDGAKGNYWSDYGEKYPNATEIDGAGIWDTPYVIDAENQDNYPIVPEFPTWTSMLLMLIILTVAVAFYKRRLLKTPNH